MSSAIPFWSLLTLLVTGIYACIILLFRHYWQKIPVLSKRGDAHGPTFVSVIIVGRNEACNIPGCIGSIAANQYPKSLFEIIYVDDHSTDASLTVLQNIAVPNLKIIPLEHEHLPGFGQSFKKMGVALAVSHAQGQLILQTDADTVVGLDWIRDHVALFEQHEHVFTAAAVLTEDSGHWLAAFQKLDFLVSMGLTGAGIQSGWHYMANGANMSFTKEAFLRADLSASRNLASGDDMFLIQAMAKTHPGQIHFLKSRDSVVFTKPEKTLKAFFGQRIRWASKTGKYKSYTLLFIAAFVLLVNMVWLTNLVLTFFHPAFLYLFLLVFFLKLIADYAFIKSVSSFYKQKLELTDYLFSSLFYPFYYLFTGIMAIFIRKYEWKGRRVHK